MFDISWQDGVFMVGNLLFFVALIPSMVSVNKPAKSTSLMTASVLTVYIFAYYSLSLVYAMVTGIISGLAWWILYFQKR